MGMESLSANEVGPFDGSKTVRIKNYIYLLEIHADGPWTLQMSKCNTLRFPETI